MATMTPQGTLPAAGAGMVAAPLTDTLNHIINTYNGNNADENNVDYSSADGIMVLAQAQTRTAALTQKAAFTVGEDDTGHDVKFFGATTGKSFLWDESADKLIITGDMSVSGTISDLGTVTTVDINGGTIDGAIIGGASAAAITATTLNATGGGSLTGTWSDLGTVTTVDINGGTIDGATIGGASAGAGTFTTLVANTSITGTLATASQPNITGLGTIGSLVATTADINAGTVDAVIGGTTPAAGTFTTLAGTTSVVAASDITITSGSILSASGAITFGDENLTTTGTFGAGAGTLTSLSVSDGNITNVGNIALDSISADDASDITMTFASGKVVVSGATTPFLQVQDSTSPATLSMLADNSTGIVRTETAHNLVLGTNTVAQMTFVSGGTVYTAGGTNFGVGGVPTTAFHVQGGTTPRIRVEDTTTPVAVELLADNSMGYVQTQTNHPLVFRVSESEKMRIDSAGNVGIGGTPAGTRKVEIHNSRATAYSAGNLETWADQMLWNTDGTAGSATGIAFMDRVTAYSSNGAAGIVGIRQAGDYEMDLAFIVRPNSAASAEAMRINSSGNVGIGDNDPLAKVHIKGSGTSGQVTVGQIMENTSSGTWFADIIGSAGSSRYRMGYSGGAGTGTNSMTEAFSMMLEGSGAGNVGIGGSPVSYKLEVHGSAPTLMLKSTGATDDLQLRLEQSGGPVGTIGYDDSEGLLYFNQFGNATVGLVVDSSHNVGIGAAPSYPLDIQVVNGGSAEARLYANNSGNGRAAIFYLTGGAGGDPASYSALQFGNISDQSYSKLRIQNNAGTEVASFENGGNFIVPVGNVFIGDTSNANMTQGLTINQGANDNEIFALKSSDVAHGMTGQSETDTYFSLSKLDATTGGIEMKCHAEDAAQTTCNIDSFGGTASTTKTTSGQGLINFNVRQRSGTGLGDVASDGNVFSVRAQSPSSSLLTKFMIDEDGDMYSVTAGTTFDSHDDVALIDAYDKSVDPKGAIRGDFAKFAGYNEQTLIDAGVLGAPISEGGMTNVTQLQRLHNGAIRQIAEKLYDALDRLQLAESKLKMLEV